MGDTLSLASPFFCTAMAVKEAAGRLPLLYHCLAQRHSASLGLSLHIHSSEAAMARMSALFRFLLACSAGEYVLLRHSWLTCRTCLPPRSPGTLASSEAPRAARMSSVHKLAEDPVSCNAAAFLAPECVEELEHHGAMLPCLLPSRIAVKDCRQGSRRALVAGATAGRTLTPQAGLSRAAGTAPSVRGSSGAQLPATHRLSSLSKAKVQGSSTPGMGSLPCRLSRLPLVPTRKTSFSPSTAATS